MSEQANNPKRADHLEHMDEEAEALPGPAKKCGSIIERGPSANRVGPILSSIEGNTQNE